MGSKWRHPAMGGVPVGLDWPAIYPLMDRLAGDAWADLHDDLAVMEFEAMRTMKEFAPKQQK